MSKNEVSKRLKQHQVSWPQRRIKARWDKLGSQIDRKKFEGKDRYRILFWLESASSNGLNNNKVEYWNQIDLEISGGALVIVRNVKRE
jgi:hypothetical protein